MDKSYIRGCFLIVISAPSGGGKSTICQGVLERLQNVEYSISYTTRKQRGTEVNGKDYFFVSEVEFRNILETDDFLEHAIVHNNWYGTSRSFILERFAKNKHVIMDIDVQGAEAIVESGIDVVTIFLLPPTIEELEERLRKRNTDSDEAIRLRLNNARSEIDKLKDYQYLVINDDLETAVEDVLKIIKAEENRVRRYETVAEIFYGGKINE
jgi:guanylate kinase